MNFRVHDPKLSLYLPPNIMLVSVDFLFIWYNLFFLMFFTDSLVLVIQEIARYQGFWTIFGIMLSESFEKICLRLFTISHLSQIHPDTQLRKTFCYTFQNYCHSISYLHPHHLCLTHINSTYWSKIWMIKKFLLRFSSIGSKECFLYL